MNKGTSRKDEGHSGFPGKCRSFIENMSSKRDKQVRSPVTVIHLQVFSNKLTSKNNTDP